MMIFMNLMILLQLWLERDRKIEVKIIIGIRKFWKSLVAFLWRELIQHHIML
jgi:hypothetical protein